ncbi:MAG: GNAT family N-acetyltransferase [Ferruginibacter sp.]
MTPTFFTYQFDELSAEQLYALLRLRATVFIVEQQCVYQDLDNKDQSSLHLLGYQAETLVAYARILPPGLSYREASIGRVVTSPQARKHGFGKGLMKEAIRFCQHRYHGVGIRISAQEYLLGFYGDLGFEAVGEPYLEDGIPHVEMILKTAQ